VSFPTHPPSPVTPKYRPRARWWAVGVAMILLAIAVFAGGLFAALRPLTQQDGIVTSGDPSVTLDVPSGAERALFTRYDAPADCTVTDSDGRTRPLELVTGDYTYNDWVAINTFDTGSGNVSVSCTSTSDVRVAQIPSTGRFVISLVVAIGVPILLGFGGLAVLVVTGILTATRPRRPTGA
jgi:hypothetical protein